MRKETVINIQVAGAQKPLIRHGIFHEGERICDIEDDVPEDYLEKHVTVRFYSGLMLNCLGRRVPELRKGRE